MKATVQLLLLLMAGASTLSCSRVSPDKYVQVAVLNTNLVTSKYSPSFFRELRELKEQGRLTVFRDNQPQEGTAVEYVEQNVIASVDEAMKKVEALPQSEKTEALTRASLEVFRYGQKIFEAEYMAIAKMLDENKPPAAIDTAIQQLFTSHDPELGKRMEKLDELAIAYARKHEVPLQFK